MTKLKLRHRRAYLGGKLRTFGWRRKRERMADALNDSNWRLYGHALDILEGRRNGHALPILRKLACAGFAPAVGVLSDFVPAAEAVILLRRAARRGDPTSAYNLAITHRNQGDMRAYRLALAQAARLDPDAASELRSFKTRFPHTIMGRLRRLEPVRRG